MFTRAKIIIVAIPLIAITGMFLAIVMPTIISNVIERAVVETLKNNYDLKECSYVRVDAGATALLTGNIEQIHIECKRSDFSGVKPKILKITLRDINLDLRAALLERESKIQSIGSANAKVIFGEQEINQYLLENHPDLNGWTVELESSEMVAKAEVEFIGDLEVTFKPRLKGNRLVLEPAEAKFERMGHVGLKEARNWIGDIPIDIPVSNLPFGMKISKVVVQGNELAVTAEN